MSAKSFLSINSKSPRHVMKLLNEIPNRSKCQVLTLPRWYWAWLKHIVSKYLKILKFMWGLSHILTSALYKSCACKIHKEGWLKSTCDVFLSLMLICEYSFRRTDIDVGTECRALIALFVLPMLKTSSVPRKKAILVSGESLGRCGFIFSGEIIVYHCDDNFSVPFLRNI